MLIFSGPCIIESPTSAISIAHSLKQITKDVKGIDFCFKASYDKANRTSIHSFRGLGLEKALDVLKAIKDEFQIPVLTDVHSVGDVDRIAQVVDVCQVPAFLCRQTDLLLAVADTGKKINVKRGQFMAPYDMMHVVEKLRTRTDADIYLTERGFAFGYNDLVVDFRSFSYMKETGCKVIFDASHSFQYPSKGGTTRFSRQMARAAVAYGVDGLFMETHYKPEKALSDASTTLSLPEFKLIIEDVVKLQGIKFNE